MNLILISSGFMNFSTGEIYRELQEELLKKTVALKKRTIGLIYTARQPDDWKWLDLYDKELKTLGFSYDVINISEALNAASLPEYDIYYVCGGNTFYILDRLRRTGMDTVLQSAVGKGKLYIGVSAGSIIAGPDISTSGFGGDLADTNDVHLVDLTGFSWVPFHLSPHFTLESQREIEIFVQIKHLPIVALTDGQAIVVSDTGVKLVGGNGGIQWGNLPL